MAVVAACSSVDLTAFLLGGRLSLSKNRFTYLPSRYRFDRFRKGCWHVAGWAIPPGRRSGDSPAWYGKLIVSMLMEAAPPYIVELAPPKSRGKLAGEVCLYTSTH